MAQADKDKSKFLSKLARFVANPTTDWSALDQVAASQKSEVPAAEDAELTQAEVFAMRYQRRKDNLDIRIKEFAMLRQVRAGASVPAARSMASSHSVNGGQAVPVPASAQYPAGDEHKSNTLIGGFSVNKINHIEQQMAEQWWDKGGKDGQSRPMPEPLREAMPKTQMLIETQIAQFDLPVGVESSDVIAFDPAMLESLPAASVPSTPSAQQATQAATAAVHASADGSVLQPVQSVPVPAQQAPQQMPAPAVQPVTAQHALEPVATLPVQQQPVVVAPVLPVQHPGSSPQVASQPHEPPQPAAHAPVASVAPVAPVQPAPAPQAVMPVATDVAVSRAAPVSTSQTAEALASPPSHGSGEQVDFSAEQPSAQAAATFVYRSAFADELPESDCDAEAALGSLGQEGGKSQQILTEADSRSVAEAQAELLAGAVPQYAVPAPPEYTPADLPECLNEPAILFTQGNHAQTEAQLLELVQAERLRAQMGQGVHEEPHVLLALLDFYRCTEQEDKFEAASIEMVRHFDRSAPQYQGADLGEASRILSTLGAFADIDYSNQNGWRCPAELDLTDVMLLRAQLMTQPAQVLLDWRMLHLIHDDAVEPLLDQFRDLAGRKVDLLMWGSEQLLASCVRKIEAQAGVPSSMLSQLWLLRLELVRIIHGQEAFDHLAIEYCVALEESPPAWVRTRCHFIDADNALSMLDEGEEDTSATRSGDTPNGEEITLKHPLQWKGTFKGNIQAVLQAVENAIQGDFCVIDCSQFNGMDYPAAVALLEWLMLQQQAQRQIQFVQVNRLLAVFWRVLGITAQASVKLRRD